MSALQSHLRRAAASGRTTEQVGPFLATFATGSANPFLNYAIPDDGASPTPADVHALALAYRRRALLPRVEFLAGTAPEAETALLAAGWSVERRVPVMLCPPGSAVSVPAPTGIELLVPRTDEELRGLLDAQREAFGAPPASGDDVTSAREQLRAGGFAVLARDATTGAAVVGATSEVAGIGVREAYRRRGIGAAVTSLTVAVHAAGGRTVFLTPAGAVEQRLYARVGYVPAGTMLHLTREPSAG